LVPSEVHYMEKILECFHQKPISFRLKKERRGHLGKRFFFK